MIPVVSVDGKELPVLIHGISPFMGAGQFGSRAEEYHRRFYSNPGLISQFFIYFSSKCYPCIHIAPYPPIIEAVELTAEVRSINVIATVEDESEIELIINFDPIIVFLHASVTDQLDIEKIRSFAESCHDLGIIPGIATHKPGYVLPKIDEIELVRAYMVPINPIGLYMEPSYDTALLAIENSKNSGKYIFGIKTLAAGRINPYKGFPFAFKYSDSIIVGFTELDQIDEACRIVKKIFEFSR
ncbi:hypothetical protein Asulf_01777 [Archaeoglobus sulfaticallidus PM70-1]|uniref:Uncharacterized protein n=1 Tax=Archaeoglobus sulfaticallidus PM70-1 TaxID=387631 RepID=N0BFE4_9EURY|nr:hypothetical protein [Archaeoglobus sulfaticallidus]AGK61748.1 hypothetical protein Asulf_01777 [Archaeoglobus sulfaticallidus PM70-1]